MLVYLGIVRLRDTRRGPHLHVHRHVGVEHAHFHLHPTHLHHAATDAHTQHSHAPLWIGILNGFAGTAAVMALLPAVIIDHAGSYLLYVLAFGLGSTLSMAAYCSGINRLMNRHTLCPAPRGLLVGVRGWRVECWSGDRLVRARLVWVKFTDCRPLFNSHRQACAVV